MSDDDLLMSSRWMTKQYASYFKSVSAYFNCSFRVRRPLISVIYYYYYWGGLQFEFEFN